MNPRPRPPFAAALIAAAAALTGCASNAPLRTVPRATDADRAVLLDRVKALAGEWESDAHPGAVSAVFAVSSGGSIVREVMFPGHGHEMTNVYHMDGPDLIATHYCAVGNQPRMRATAATAAADRIHFRVDSVTNLHDRSATYMGDLTLFFLAPDHIRQEWRSYEGGALNPNPTIIELRRKR